MGPQTLPPRSGHLPTEVGPIAGSAGVGGGKQKPFCPGWANRSYYPPPSPTDKKIAVGGGEPADLQLDAGLPPPEKNGRDRVAKALK